MGSEPVPYDISTDFDVCRSLKAGDKLGNTGGNVVEELFLGKHIGVGLCRRRHLIDDQHIVFVLLYENLGEWSWTQRYPTLSTYWLPEVPSVFEAVKKWLEENAEQDFPHPRGSWPEGVACGWKFGRHLHAR
jgi:hypothetical protein